MKFRQQDFKNLISDFETDKHAIISFSREIWKFIRIARKLYGYDNVRILAIQNRVEDSLQILKNCLENCEIDEINTIAKSVIINTHDKNEKFSYVIVIEDNHVDAIKFPYG